MVYKQDLSGGTRTSVGDADRIIQELLESPSNLDEIYQLFLDEDAVVAMRASYVAMRVAEQKPETVAPFAKLLPNLPSKIQPCLMTSSLESDKPT